MVTLTARYQGDLHCDITHGPSGTVLPTDAPKDNQGKGEYFSPTDLVAAALSSCMLTVMGITARKLNVEMADAEITIEKVMAASPTRCIGTLNLTITMPAGIAPEHRAALEHAALTCPVVKSLNPEIAIKHQFAWG